MRIPAFVRTASFSPRANRPQPRRGRDAVRRAIESLEQRRLLSVSIGDDPHHHDEAHAHLAQRPVWELPFQVQAAYAGTTDAGAIVSHSGNAFFLDGAPALVNQPPAHSPGADGDGGGGGDTQASLPILHSNPSAAQKIFLDFDGHVVTGTPWNTDFYSGNPIHAAPYSLDTDLFNFSSAEASSIEEIWRRVAEDFSPFNIDVTTQDPGNAALTAGAQALRVLISTNEDSAAMGGTGQKWFGEYGGVAYLSSWRWTSDTPVWTFYDNLGGGFAKYVTEAASHEVGHALDLNHDGTGTTGYYEGHGSGPTGWAPLMGVGYHRELSQWSKGEYSGANNTEDDLAIIAQTANKITFRTDSVSNSTSGAPSVPLTNPSATLRQFDGASIIETRSDVDVWKLDLTGGDGRLALQVAPTFFLGGYNNLDIKADLLNSAGSVIQSVNPVDDVDAFFDLNLTAGTYYVRVDGVGKGTTSTGYSDYGSIGQYEIFGDWEYAGSGGAGFTESGGRVDMEAEASTGSASGSGATWAAFSDPAASGGSAVVANPNNGLNVGDSTNGPRRDYSINFTNTGTYYVWVRMSGPSGSDDSLHVGLDGALASGGAQGVALATSQRDGDWHWIDRKSNGVRLTVNVTTPGVHTFNLWMREDGTRADEFILTKDAAFNPNSGGGAGFQESGGRVDMQAESSTGQSAGSGSAAGHTWATFSDGTAGGGSAVIANPNSGVNVGDSTSGPRRDYSINFTNTGTYYVWVRMKGASGSDDSLHVGMNGTAASFGAQGIALDTAERGTGWHWKDKNSAGTRVTLNVTSAGIRTFNLWMREDGMQVDQFILTKDANFNPNSGGGGGFTESGGRVDMQAESSTGSASGSGATWDVFSDGSAGGGSAVVANPNSGVNLGDSTAGPRRDYSINFTNTGTYYVWVRMKGPSGSDDSLHVGINGSLASGGAQGIALDTSERGTGWHWKDRTSAGTRVTVNVTSAGVRTFNLWMREDGVQVDQFILTKDSAFNPAA